MLAFTFPGQGSQRPGMGEPWVDEPSWELVEEASEIAGRDVGDLLVHADAEALRQTRNAQLATFVLSLVVLDAVERVGVVPSITAGHSLGEYTALCGTGALSFPDAVRIVTERGDAMQEAAEDSPGTMAAVLGLDDDDVDAACRRAEGDVWVANFNAPGQVVIAGGADSVARAGDVAKDLGAKKVMPLPVSGAFHTPFMASARERLKKAVAHATLRLPDVPVVANIDARAHTDPDEWESLLSAQLTSPVRWRQTVMRLADDGVDTFVELGPGGVLTGMVKRIASGVRTVAVATPDDLDNLLEVLSGEPPVQVPAGEHLYMHERLVVSPAAGVFALDDAWKATGSTPDDHGNPTVDVGQLLGRVGSDEVRSLFAGELMSFVAVDGERLTAGQPVAWLRT